MKLNLNDRPLPPIPARHVGPRSSGACVMNDLLNEEALREMAARRGKDHRFGCATGRMSLAMARAAGPQDG